MGTRYNHLPVEKCNDIQAGLNLGLSRPTLARRRHRLSSTVTREIRSYGSPAKAPPGAANRPEGGVGEGRVSVVGLGDRLRTPTFIGPLFERVLKSGLDWCLQRR